MSHSHVDGNVDGHRPNLPIKGAGRREDAHSRWTLPLSLVLSILLWLSLNDSVHKEESISCQVIVQDLGKSSSTGVPGQILVRLPESRTQYTKSQILDSSFKLLDRKVRLYFAGPGRFVSDLDRRLKVWAEVQIPEDGQDEFTYKITKSDLRTDPSDLSPFLVKMDPETINIKFVASGEYRLNLHPEQVQIEYPEPIDSWQSRINVDTMNFEPKFVTLKGPAKLLEQLKRTKLIFKLDCRRTPELLERGNYKAGSTDRTKLGFNLVLMQRFDQLSMSPEIKVRIEVGLEPPRFPQDSEKDYYTIPVYADWYASPLDPKSFEVSKSVRIQIYSYDPDLSLILKKGGEAWVQRNLRASVDLGEIEGDYKNTKAFFKGLTAHFTCYDDNYRKDHDFRIEALGIVEVKRR